MKQNDSKKEENKNSFNTWVDIHRPNHVFMKFYEFGSYVNMAII